MVDAGRVIFQVGIDRASTDRAIADLERRLANVGDIDLKIPNTSAATGVAQQVESAFSRIRTPNLSFSADTSRLERSVARARGEFDSIQSAIDALNRQRIEVDFRVKRGDSDLARIEAQILKLQRQRIEIPVVTLEGAARIRAIEADIEKLNARRIKIEADTGSARSQLSELDRTLEQLDGDNAEQALRQLNERIRETGRAAKNAQGDTRSFNAVLSGLAGGAAVAVLDRLVDAFGALTNAVTGFVAASIQANAQLRNTTNALEILLGSNEAAAESIEFLRQTSESTGQSFQALQNNYAGITAAAAEFGLPQEAVNELFAETSRVLGIFGKSSAESGLAFNALTQIFAKGQVSLEELRQQLGEQLPVALTASANGLQELGVLTTGTTSELLDLISTGLDAATFAEGFTLGLKQIEGSAPAAQQAIASLENAVLQLQQNLGASLEPLETAFSETFANIFSEIDPSALDPLTEAGNRLREALSENPKLAERLGEALTNFVGSGAEAVAEILDRITQALSNPGNVEAFAEGIENAGERLQELISVAIEAADILITLGGFYAELGNTFNDVTSTAIKTLTAALGILNDALKAIIDSGPRAGGAVADAFKNVPGIGTAVEAFRAVQAFRDSLPNANASNTPDLEVDTSQLVPQQDEIDKFVRASRDASDQVAADSERAAKRAAAERAKADKEAAEEFEKANKEALANIEIAQQNRIAAVRQNQIAGNITEDQADAQVSNIEQDAIQERIALREQEIAKVEELASRQAISEKDAANQIRAARQEVADLTLEALDKEIAAQEAAADAAKDKAEEAKKAALEQLDAQQRLNDIQAEQVNIQSNIASTALQDQSDLIGAQVGLEQARLSLSRQNLEGKLAEAEAAEDLVAVEAVRDRILLNQRRSISAEFSARREQLRIQQQLAQVDADRQLRLGQIAEAESRIAVERARADGASDEEIQALQNIAQLREQESDALESQANSKRNILDLQLDQLNTQEQLAEQQALQERREQAIESFKKQQKDLADEQLKVEKDLASATEDRASAADRLVSSLSGLEDVTGEDALSSLDQLEDNLRTARRSGGFGGQDAADLQRAIDQAQRFARSGDGFSIDEAFRFADTDNPFAGSILDAVGLGSVGSFLDAQQEVAIADSQIETLTTKLDEVREAVEGLEIPAGIENLTVSTPDPVVDAATVAAQVNRRQRIAGGVI